MSRALESWSIMLEWIGNKPQVLPLIEYVAGQNSNGSGTFLSLQLNDATWECKTRLDASLLYAKLKAVCRSARFSTYMRLQLFEELPRERGEILLQPARKPRKTDKRLAVYTRGKTPDFSKLIRKPPRSRKPRTIKRQNQLIIK